METLCICDFCKYAFNTTDRIPYGLYPCQHFACEPCTKELKEKGNECKRNHQQPVEIKEFLIITSILDKLKSNFEIIVHCSKHPNKEAEFFHMKKNVFICTKCAILEEHRDVLINQDQEIFMKQGELLCNYASQFEQKIEAMKKLGNGMFKRTISYSGDEIYAQISDSLQCLINFNIHIDKDVFSVYKGRFPRLQEENKELSINEQHQLQSTAFLQNNSLICQQQANYAAKVVEWLDPKYKLECLRYRGTLYEFRAAQFHEKCDGQGPTLTLVQTIDNYFFGGFTSVSWSRSGHNMQDEDAFIFSLTHSTKHPIKKEQIMYSIICRPDRLSVFGDGHDFLLVDKCNINQSSSSNLGHTYQLLPGAESQAQTYLAGKYQFYVKEVEVFQFTML